MRLNRGEVNWFGCNFTLPSGGDRIARRICAHRPMCPRSPANSLAHQDTHTHRKGNSHTDRNQAGAPTASYRALDGQSVPQPGPLTLHWVGLSGLNDRDEYLLELIDQRTNAALSPTSPAPIHSRFRLPSCPADGQTRMICSGGYRSRASRRSRRSIAMSARKVKWRSFRWLEQLMVTGGRRSAIASRACSESPLRAAQQLLTELLPRGLRPAMTWACLDMRQIPGRRSPAASSLG